MILWASLHVRRSTCLEQTDSEAVGMLMMQKVLCADGNVQPAQLFWLWRSLQF